jgi:hypothetical protein
MILSFIFDAFLSVGMIVLYCQLEKIIFELERRRKNEYCDHVFK